MFAVSGRRPQDNLFLLNGIEYTGSSLINVTPGGTSGQLLGVDAVREFNVATDTYGATYGKRDGAQVSIITTSGTNRFHGTAFEFIRNSAFDARNYFDQGDIPEFQRNQFGGSLGGPIRKDKLFLFGNYEGFRQNWGLSAVTLVPDNRAREGYLPNSKGGEQFVGVNPAVAPLLALWPVQNGPELGGGIAEAFSHPEQHIREDFGTTRFDDNLSGKDLLFAVYTVDDSTANTPSQNPLSLIDESLARAGSQRAGAACLFPGPPQHRPLRLLTRQLLLHRLLARSILRLGHRSAHRRHRHQRQHRLQRRIRHLAGRSQRRQQQLRHAQPLHLGRSRLLDARPQSGRDLAYGSSASSPTICSPSISTARPRSAPCKHSCRAR